MNGDTKETATMNFQGEIQYLTSSGAVHSDIGMSADGAVTAEYRKFLHDCLDEWLKQSNGTGAFWVGDPRYFYDWDPV